MPLLFVAAIAVFALGDARSAGAQVPTGWIGTWTLDLSRSTYDPGPPPYRRASYTIEPWTDGLKVTYEMVYPRGGVSHLEWMGKLDGRDYPLQGMDEFMTYAYRPQGDGSYEVTVKVDGRPVASATILLSADGLTMTTRTTGRNAAGRRVTTTTVYRKQ